MAKQLGRPKVTRETKAQDSILDAQACLSLLVVGMQELRDRTPLQYSLLLRTRQNLRDAHQYLEER